MAARDVFGIVGTTQAGNFHVERVVAEGGFGVVYRAQHGAFRAPVALKCLKIPEAMTKQQRSLFLEKFREEAELMFRLSAAITEVVRPLHVDVLILPDGRFVPFLALEWLEGESLDGIITRRRTQGQAPLGLHKVVKMMRPVATALSKAHRFPGPQGAVSIVHRDLKPENIFVANIGGNESMKILDYGIAKAKRAASQAAGRITVRSLEEDETASFTPAYGAPEQWTPKTYGETGPWTDVWGLGLTIVEALCGSPPLDGDTYVMRRACLDDKRRPTPRQFGADVPVEVDKVFEKALAVDPRRRFNDIESFWSELEVSMGLVPSLRPRDRRREEEPDSVETPPPTPAASSGGQQRLAKIELLKVPSVLEVPASPRAVPEPPPLLSMLTPLEPLVALGPLPARARTGVASEMTRPRTGPAPENVRPALENVRLENVRPAPENVRPTPVKTPPTGEIPSRAKAMLEAAGVTPRSDDEDWSSLGLGDDAASPPSERRPEPPPSERRQPEPSPRKRPPPPPPATHEGPVRRMSAELELSLPLQHAPSHSSGSWELSLPSTEAAPEPTAYTPPTPPVSAPAPRPSARGTPPVSAPAPAPAPAPRPPARPPPSRRHSIGMELSLPSMAAAPDPGPRRSLSGELELNLPTMAAAPAAAPAPAAHHPTQPTPPGPRAPAASGTPAARPAADSDPGFELGGDMPGRGSTRAPPPGPETKPPPPIAAPEPTVKLAPSLALKRAGETAGPTNGALSLRERLKAPLGLLLAALMVAGLGAFYRNATGNELEIGPVRSFWIAAPLALVGVGFLLWRLMGAHDDDDD